MFNLQESVAVNPHDFVRQVNARQADTEGLSVIAKITSGFGNGGGAIDDPQAAALNQLQEDYAPLEALGLRVPKLRSLVPLWTRQSKCWWQRKHVYLFAENKDCSPNNLGQSQHCRLTPAPTS